jgi:hypothetical protein
MIVPKKMLVVSLLGAAVVGGLAFHSSTGRAAPTAPAHVVMLTCSTETDLQPILSSASTNPAIRIDAKTARCVDAMKTLLDANMKIVDVKYGEDGRRVIYTAVTAEDAPDFNVSRSNKDKG